MFISSKYSLLTYEQRQIQVQKASVPTPQSRMLKKKLSYG